MMLDFDEFHTYNTIFAFLKEPTDKYKMLSTKRQKNNGILGQNCDWNLETWTPVLALIHINYVTVQNTLTPFWSCFLSYKILTSPT